MTTQTKVERKDGPRSKRGIILEAAIDGFGRDGFEHTKWATIADEVGIGQTALYHYFESKAHCLLTIMSLELERSQQRFKDATAEIEDPRTVARSRHERVRRDAREALAARILLSTWTCSTTKRHPSARRASASGPASWCAPLRMSGPHLLVHGMAEDVLRAARSTAVQLGRPGADRRRLAVVPPQRGTPLSEIAEFITDACERVVGP